MAHAPIDLKTPNIRTLELLSFLEINRLRQNENLPNLDWDDVLYRAAKDHATYLLTKTKLSHNQHSKEKRNPVTRVRLHGGVDFSKVSENVIDLSLGIRFQENGLIKNTITYASTSQALTKLFTKSKSTRRNTFSDHYNYSATAVAYDSSSQRLVAVQVFGFSNTPLSIPKLEDISTKIPNLGKPQLPYGLKKYQYKKRELEAVKDFSKLKLEKGYLTGSFKSAKKIFKGKKSGIVMEFIPLSQYDVNSKTYTDIPNRRNGLFELNGKLNEPIYRHKLLKYSRLVNDDYFIYTRFLKIKKRPQTFIFPLPTNSSQYEYNIILLKKKKITTLRSYISVPWSYFDTPFPDLKVTNHFYTLDSLPKYRVLTSFDTLNFRAYYKTGEVEVHPDTVKQLLNKFKNLDGRIKRVKATSYASIEGDRIANNQLALKRKEYFIQYIQPWIDQKSVKSILKYKEQWKLFHQQIQDSPLEHLGKMKMDEVRAYVNTNKEDPYIANLLNQQRYTDFELIWEQEYKEFIHRPSPESVFDSLLHVIKTAAKPTKNLFSALEKAQLAYYKELYQNKSYPQTLLEVPFFEKHPEFRYHELVFQFTHYKNINEEQFFRRLHTIGTSDNFPSRLKSDLIYNNLVIIFSQYQQDKLRDLLEDPYCPQMVNRDYFFKQYKKINCKRNNWVDNDFLTLKAIQKLVSFDRSINGNKHTDDLWRYFYLNLIKYYNFQIPPNSKINGLTDDFKRYFHPDDSKLSDQERLKYALFYCAIDKFKTAKKLIEPIATRAEPHVKGLQLYVCLKFDEFDSEHDFANYLIEQFPYLGEQEWCNLWKNPEYLNFILLEDLKLKNFYNCNCSQSL
ncbi:CAP domain-containing protein [Sediminitomix flava]|nr:CAP domain-containing protein [Sediminitomix flava]